MTLFISCDWGTTNFRLRLVDSETLAIQRELSTTVGIKAHWSAFQRSGRTDQQAYGLEYLAAQINQLDAKQTIPVVISGMASADIGVRGLPYARLPIDASGRQLNYWSGALADGRPFIMVSGVRDEEDVMRGEEIQAVGLAELLQPYERAMLLLPGTHSKHLRWRGGAYRSFTTYLTGELFALLSQESLLRNSVAGAETGAVDIEAFGAGVDRALSGGLTANLFSVRARTLLQGATATASHFYLSGLLIGEELRYLVSGEGPVVLAATGAYAELYGLALGRILSGERLVIAGGATLATALLRGQRQMLRRYEEER